VDARAQAHNFYGLGARMLDLFEEEEVLDVLVEAYRTRAAEIADHAVNSAAGGARGGGGGQPVGTEAVEFLRGLDEWERGLFRTAHDSAKAVKAWMGSVKKA
jgi:GINS complex subunit 3